MTIKARLILMATTFVFSFILIIVFAETAMFPDFALTAYHSLKWKLLSPFYEIGYGFLEASYFRRLTSLALFVVTVFGLVYVVRSWKGWKEQLRESSDWKKSMRARIRSGRSRLFLGLSQPMNKPVYISNRIRAEHMLVLGSTGTGKTRSVLEPAICHDILYNRGAYLHNRQGGARFDRHDAFVC